MKSYWRDIYNAFVSDDNPLRQTRDVEGGKNYVCAARQTGDDSDEQNNLIISLRNLAEFLTACQYFYWSEDEIVVEASDAGKCRPNENEKIGRDFILTSVAAMIYVQDNKYLEIDPSRPFPYAANKAQIQTWADCHYPTKFYLSMMGLLWRRLEPRTFTENAFAEAFRYSKNMFEQWGGTNLQYQEGQLVTWSNHENERDVSSQETDETDEQTGNDGDTP